MNLNALLAAVEAAPPVAAVDVLATALAEAVGAREVSFLIADFSGRSLIRLGHSGGTGTLRLQGHETAERIPLFGTPHGRALSAQAVEVVAEDDRAGRMMDNQGKSRARIQHPRKLLRRRICIAVLVAELADRRPATFIDEGQGFDRNLGKDFDIRA